MADVAEEAGPVADDGDIEIDSDDASSNGDSWPAEERLARAESCKSSGNDLFKSADLPGAAKLYAQALKVLQPLRDLDDAVLDAGVRSRERALSVSLHLNAAAVELRRECWRDAAACATRALDALPSEDTASRGKALLRRGIALARCNDLEEAKADLVALLRQERGNREAAREYAQVKERLEAHRAQEKQQFAGAFGSAGASLYGDKEAARKREALRKIEAERARREDWQRDKDVNGRELSFEAWCKEDDERREADRKLAETRRREEREREEAERAAARAAERAKNGGQENDDDDDDDDDLDEEDRRILAETRKQGYCYFKRDLPEHEKQLLQASGLAPAKLPSSDSADPGENAASSSSSSAAPVSSWNAAGTTWEQRDVSAATRADLERALAGVTVETQLEGLTVRVAVSKVESVDGDAHIAVTRAKPAPLYDLSAKLKWRLSCSSEEADFSGEANGTLRLPDISNGVERHAFEAETRVKKSLGAERAPVMDAALELLRNEVCRAVGEFVDTLHLR